MFDFESGEVILIDKPLDWTSFDTVNFIRSLVNRCYGIRKLKVGHAGTLDPLATGLLIICTGKMTKQIDTYQAQVKTYTGTILLGQTTPTFDLESEPNAFFPTDNITPEQIEAARQQFAQYGMNNVPDEYLENYANDMLKKKEYVDNLVDRSIDRKLTEVMKGVVKLNPKEVTLDEFNKMMEGK